jgi:predicted PurR-regulated permease PerM
MDGPGGAGDLTGREDGRLRTVLERRAEWVEALIILSTVAAAFVVLDFLARYFQDYFRLILIFFFGWLLAFLISPVADWLQRRLTRLPRGIAVIAVIVPVILIGSLILVRVMVALADSLVQLAAALPGLIANPPAILSDIQARLASVGIHVDLVATFQTIATDLFKGLADVGVGLFGGVLSAFGTVVDAIIVVSLAVFMAIDRDKILRLGLEITAPDKREDAMLFRRSVASAAAGFIRSQLVLGGLYGIWAWIVSFVFGLPFAPATAVLSGLIMAIPIYGPYVSWLPPVAVALLVQPDIALLVAIVMLIGWFIDENVLAPVVRAGALDLNPIVVTFAFLLGAQLAGAIGAIVAIPMAAVVQAFVVKYFEQYRTKRGWPDPDTDPAAPSTQPRAPATEPDAGS